MDSDPRALWKRDAARLTFGCRTDAPRPALDRRRRVRGLLIEAQMVIDAGLGGDLPLEQTVCALVSLARDAEREALLAPL